MALQEHGDADFGGSAVVRDGKRGWCEDEGDGDLGKGSTRGMRVLLFSLSHFALFFFSFSSPLFLLRRAYGSGSSSIFFHESPFFLGWMDGRDGRTDYSLALYYFVYLKAWLSLR